MRLIIVSGQKGGVGKTLFAHSLVSWNRAHGIRFSGIDTDQENKFFAHLHDEVSQVTLYHADGALDADAIHEIVDAIANAMQGGVVENFIVDMGAGQLNAFIGAFRQTGLFAEAGRSLNLTVAYVITQSVQSLSTLVHNADAFDDVAGAQWVIVRNQVEGPTALYDDSETLRKNMLAKGSIEIEMGDLRDRTILKDWEQSGLRLEDYMAKSASWSRRATLRSWIGSLQGQFDAHASALRERPAKLAAAVPAA